MAFVYHGSDRGDLRILTPRVSTHARKYLYAARHRVIALLFLSRWNDYLLTLEASCAENQVRVTLVERYENALREIYGRKKGFIYTLDGRDFFSDPDCWDMEVVSQREQTPLARERVEDVLCEIMKLQECGDITLYHYPHRPPWIPGDDADLMQKTLELYRLSGDTYNALYCAQRFPHLKARLFSAFEELHGIDLSSISRG